MPTARRLDVPLVVTIHGSDAHLLRYQALRKLALHVLHRASLVATVSEDLQRQIEVIDPRLRTMVLRLPIAEMAPPAADAARPAAAACWPPGGCRRKRASTS